MDRPPRTPAADEEQLSIARLHGEACRYCGSTKPPLRPAGHVYTTDREGGRLGWALVACASHSGGRA